MEDLTPYLQPLGLSAWRYYSTVTSTNDAALAWARQGAPDWALVVADAQSAGRGRAGRSWVTEPGCSLAVSLILRLQPVEHPSFLRFAALGALGLIRAFAGLGLTAQLKWPNDVLLDGKKVAGVLVEADWLSDKAAFVVIGMGVNISPDSIPPIDRLRYPATAVELGLDRPVDRWALLADTLGSIRKYRFDLAEETFIQAWNDALAFRNTWVRFRQPGMDAQIVKVLGVHPDGQLALELESNRRLDVSTGEILMIGEGQSLD